MSSTFEVPVRFIVDVHEIDGGGFYGEVRQLPGCIAQAETLDDLENAIREALCDYFSEPGLMTETTARQLAEIQRTDAIPPGPYPLRRDYQPPAWWTEAHEDE